MPSKIFVAFGQALASDLNENFGLCAQNDEIVLGENLVLNDAVCYLVAYNIIIQQNSKTAATIYVGYNASSERAGQTITIGASDLSLGEIIAYIYKNGSPTNNLQLKIFQSDKTTQVGTVVAIAGASITTGDLTFDFTSQNLTLTAGQVYFLEFSVNNTLSTSNYYRVGADSDVSRYAGGTSFSYDTGAWNANAWDIYFKIYDQVPGYYKTKADDATMLGFLGFIKTAGSLGETKVLISSGVVSGFSSLSPGADYYLSNTSGLISTTPGGTSVKVARAISATKIRIL